MHKIGLQHGRHHIGQLSRLPASLLLYDINGDIIVHAFDKLLAWTGNFIKPCLFALLNVAIEASYSTVVAQPASKKRAWIVDGSFPKHPIFCF